MALFDEFKKFIARGNVLDLAVGVMLGAAFGKIVTSLTENVIMPVIGAIFGTIDFSRFYILLGSIPPELQSKATDYDALKTAGVPMIGYGMFITQVINFLIIGFVLFLLVRSVNKLVESAKKQEAEEAAAAPAAATVDPQLEALKEILEELRKGRGEA
ncbi:large conductance mechanosensitive channel protein MscL [Novosphingobium sp. 9]|uniref:large conductance mechanosensitive channel protein MscL n=1 Tax=Novosphingobium sp. 9 TaxID=2025349 RepID=UPI0021B51421|nr:large conductance mechanosensitive channel protein MscL [Novosphingobium sp. 9]